MKPGIYLMRDLKLIFCTFATNFPSIDPEGDSIG